jgi:glutathione synthase/RimK-type ligase-like ATP-grasp enzyme
MRKLLVVTNKEDVHADWIVNRLNELGHGELVVRLNTDDFVTNVSVVFSSTEAHLHFRDSGRFICDSDIGCVWYRRPKALKAPPSCPEGAKAYVEAESRHVLEAVYYRLAESAVWINPREGAARARNKLSQLRVAHELEFSVPKTIITNREDEARQFFQAVDSACVKRLAESFFQRDGDDYAFFTTRITPSDAAVLANVRHAPTQFQEYIPKLFDLRVTIIGDACHAVEIHSEEGSVSRDDFRLANPSDLIHRHHDLPAAIREKIQRFMRHYSLVFSAMDFAVTRNGDYYFLENNPNGQWLWLDLEAGADITSDFVGYLLRQIEQ